MFKKSFVFFALAAIILAGFFGTAPHAQATIYTYLAGDKDGFGVFLAEGDPYADMNAFTPEPGEVLFDRPLAGNSFTLSVPPISNYPDFTNTEAAQPSPFDISTAGYPVGTPFLTATLRVNIADVDDGPDPNVDVKLFIDGQEVPGAFDGVDQYVSGVAGESGVISIPLDVTMVENAMADGVVTVLIDEDDPPKSDWQTVEILAIDYAELVIDTGNPVPAVYMLNPSSKDAGDPGFTLTVQGINFLPSSVISWDGFVLAATNYISANELTMAVPSSAIASQGTHGVTVTNPGPGGGTSNSATFTVNGPGGGGVGTITVNKTSVGGDGTFDFTINQVSGGSYTNNFQITTVGGVGSSDQNNLPVGSYEVIETGPSGWNVNNGCTAVSVTSGGFSSCNIENTVGSPNPVPVITFISPTTRIAGSPAFLMTVNGSNFISNSIISWDGMVLFGTNFVSATQLTGFVPASAIVGVGTHAVTVTNPSPGGGTSNSATLTVTAGTPPPPNCSALPTVTSLVPPSKNEGDPGFLLTVNGTNFLPESIIYFDNLAFDGTAGQPLTNPISPTQLTVFMSVTPAPGTYDVTVVNPSIPECGPESTTTGSFPVKVAVSPNSSFVYVVNFSANTLQKFNSFDLSQAGSVNTGGTGPADVAVSPNGNFVYVVNNGSNTLKKFNTSDLAQAASVVTYANPASVAVSPDSNFVYVVSNSTGTLQKFNASDLSPATAFILTDPGPNAVAVSPTGSFVYVVSQEVGQPTGILKKYNASDLSFVASASTQGNPLGVAASPSGSFVYVVNYGSNSLQKFDATTLGLVTTSATSGNPRDLAISFNSSSIYEVNYSSDNIHRFNASNLSLNTSANTDNGPYGVAVSPDGNAVYVVNGEAGTLQKFNAALQGGGGTSNARVFTVNSASPGFIKIVKNTTNGNGTFSFNAIGATSFNKNVTTVGGTGEGSPNSVTPASNYEITENVPPGWTINSISCDRGFTYVAGSNIVTNVEVLAGQTTTCTFANTRNVVTPNTFINIIKNASGGNAAFDYEIDGPTAFDDSITTVNNAGSTGNTPVAEGTYDITELLPVGWNFEGAGCNNGSGLTGTQIGTGVTGIEVIGGQTTTCVFGNVKPVIPPGTGLKIVKNTSGGNATFGYAVAGPATFSANITTVNSTGVSGPVSVPPGTTYSIAESAIPAGWDFGSVSCDKTFTPSGNGATNILVVAGQVTTCSFYNEIDPESTQTALKIIKKTIGGNGTFDYMVSGPTGLSPQITTSGGIGVTGPTIVDAGTYSITETVPGGWTFNSVICDDGTYVQGINGATNITVTAGETTTCTFTNTINGYTPETSLTIVKNALNGDDTFNYTVGGPTPANPNITTLGGVGANGPAVKTAGSYTVDETFIGENLVGRWKFDEGSGTSALDSGPNAITGTLTGGPAYSLSVAPLNFTNPYSLGFDGGNDYVDLGNPVPLRLTGSMTLSGWVYETANVADDGQIIAKSDDGPGWQLKSTPDTGPRTFAIAVSGGAGRVTRYSSTVRSLNTWYHVAGVYNASAQTLDIYVNGVLSNGTLIGTIPAAQLNSSVNVNIGRRTGGYNIAGRLDDVRVYSRALPLSEITDLAAGNNPATWTFEGVVCDHAYTQTGSGASNVTVAVNENTTCMFTNEKAPVPPATALKIVKNTSGGNGTFNFTISGPSVSTPSIATVNNSGISGPTPVVAGSYDIAESFGGQDSSLIGYWKLDETVANSCSGGVSDACDSSGYNNNATWNASAAPSATVPATGFANPRSIFLDGSADYVDMGPFPAMDGLEKMTLSFWAKRNAPGSIISVGKGTAQTEETDIILWSDGRVYFELVSGGNADYGYITQNDTNWHLYTMVFDGSLTGNSNRLKAYLDGSLQTLTFGGGSSIPATVPSSGNFTIGDYFWGDSHGHVDDVRIYNRALSGAEVAVLGDSDGSGVQSDWTFDSISCDHAFAPSANGATAVTVVSGETTTCTFGNIKDSPEPVITSINPDTKTEGDLPFTMTINGTGFLPTSVVNFDGLGLSTSYISATRLTVFIGQVPPVGTYEITVVNPAPGGGTSNIEIFEVVAENISSDVSASNLDVSEFSCPVLDATSMTYFFWNYNNANGYNQKQFQLQISTDPAYSPASIVVNRTFANLNNAPGTLNQQTVQIKLASTDPAGTNSDFMNFGETYYWRARVWERDPVTGGLGADSGWVDGATYTAADHPGPYAKFTFSPPTPAPGVSVSFTNESICYNTTGPVACQSYVWNFGDTGSSTEQNPLHPYATTGIYGVNLRVYDETGGFCEANSNVPVTNASNNLLPRYKEISPF